MLLLSVVITYPIPALHLGSSFDLCTIDDGLKFLWDDSRNEFLFVSVV